MPTGVSVAKVPVVVLLAGPDEALNCAFLPSSYIQLAHAPWDHSAHELPIPSHHLELHTKHFLCTKDCPT